MRAASPGERARVDPNDPVEWSRALGVSVDAVEQYRQAETFDLHVDSFIWTRILGYDLHRRHGRGPLGRHWFWHVDLPRTLDGAVAGAIWSITTNPLRRAATRRRAFDANLDDLRSRLAAHPGVDVVTTASQYRAARAAGHHGAFIGIQGANALSSSLDDLDVLRDGSVVRATLVHLLNSRLGTTSSPLSRLGRRVGLTAFGAEVVTRLDDMRVLVDLAHISEAGFWAAVDAHDPTLPLIVTHTGVDGVHPHWRNLTDDQIRAVAATGGCVGVMLQESFLGRRPVSVATTVDHLAHIVDVGGEDAAAIGTDFDGLVSPPRALVGHATFPRLVEEMRRRRWSDDRVAKVLGANALRTISMIRD